MSGASMPAEADKLLEQAARARREHRPADAKRDLCEAVALCRNSKNPAELALALAALGQIERDLKNNAAALQHYEEAATLYRAEGNALKIAHTIRHLGDIHLDEGHPELAEPLYGEALAFYRAQQETPPLELANAIRGLAILKGDAGDNDEARALWQEAKQLYTALNVQAGIAESSRRLALLSF